LLPVNNALVKIVDEKGKALEYAMFDFKNDHTARVKRKGEGYYSLSWKRGKDHEAIIPIIVNFLRKDLSAIAFLDSQSESVEIVVRRPVKLKGRLLDVDGKPTCGKIDLCLINENAPESFDRREIGVAPDGYFEFEKLISGYSYQITASTSSHERGKGFARRIRFSAKDMKAGATKNVEIQFVEGNLSVSGTVTDADGNIPRILSVIASGEDQPLLSNRRRLIRIRAGKEFLIEGLVAGEVTLEIHAMFMRPVGDGVFKSHKLNKVIVVTAGTADNNVVFE
jgi:hypothetical protein